MKKTGYISMKKTAIDLNFFFKFMENKNIFNLQKTMYFYCY